MLSGVGRGGDGPSWQYSFITAVISFVHLGKQWMSECLPDVRLCSELAMEGAAQTPAAKPPSLLAAHRLKAHGVPSSNLPEISGHCVLQVLLRPLDSADTEVSRNAEREELLLASGPVKAGPWDQQGLPVLAALVPRAVHKSQWAVQRNPLPSDHRAARKETLQWAPLLHA